MGIARFEAVRWLVVLMAILGVGACAGGARGQAIERLPATVSVPTARFIPTTAIPTTAIPKSAVRTMDPVPVERIVYDEYRLEAPVEVEFGRSIRRHKEGFFQKAQLSGGWVGSGSGQDLGMSHVATSVSVAIPLGGIENILAVTPSFRVDTIDGPNAPDIPGQLYVTGVNFFWRRKFNDRWGVTAAATPSVRSDFQTSDDAVRVFGLLMADWVWWPGELEFSFGAVHLGRDDVSVLPAAGFRWTPNPDLLVQMMFPRPKIAYRVGVDGGLSETWAYVAGGFGGDTWAVKRESGASDTLTILDYRLVFGLEQVVDGGGGEWLEVGYVFGREAEYASSAAEFQFGDAIMLEAGIAY